MRLLPHMKDYGNAALRIRDMKHKIEEISNQTLKFKDYQKAKKEH